MASSTSLDDAGDADLVRHAMVGGRDAFAEIYRRYHTVIYRFARMMSGSPAVAEDVTQETFTTLLRDLQRYAPDRAALSTYLYGVARNLTRSRLRRERRFVHLEVKEEDEPASVADPSTVFEQSQQRQRLRQIIAELPSRYREVVVLCAIHGLSYAEVAAILGTPVGTVRSRLSRARRAIANRLRDLEENTDAVPVRTARCAV
jgi:RNA polymerase sigma-70 factor (ECF subfamily)